MRQIINKYQKFQYHYNTIIFLKILQRKDPIHMSNQQTKTKIKPTIKMVQRALVY